MTLQPNKVLARAIAQRGFKKSSGVYVRDRDGVTHIVETQRARTNAPGRSSFTLNAGVFVPGVTSAFSRVQEPEAPRLTDCCFHVRVGMLSESRLDIWWELSSSWDSPQNQQIEEEVARAVSELVSPFFDRFQSRHDVASFLTEEPHGADVLVDPRSRSLRLVYAGLIWGQLGESSIAVECIRNAVEASRKNPLAELVTRFAEEWEE